MCQSLSLKRRTLEAQASFLGHSKKTLSCLKPFSLRPLKQQLTRKCTKLDRFKASLSPPRNKKASIMQGGAGEGEKKRSFRLCKKPSEILAFFWTLPDSLFTTLCCSSCGKRCERPSHGKVDEEGKMPAFPGQKCSWSRT